MAPRRELGAFLLALLACCGGRRLAEAAGGPGGRRGAAADACGGRVSSAGLGPAAAQVGRCCREGSGCRGAGGAAAAGLCAGSAAGRNRGVPGGDAEWDFPSVRGGDVQVINVLLRGFAFRSRFCCVLLSDSSLLSSPFLFCYF